MSKQFDAILEEVCGKVPAFRHYLTGCDGALFENRLILIFKEPYTRALVGKSENRKLIADSAKNITGRAVKVVIPDDGGIDWDGLLSGLVYDDAKAALDKGVSIGNKIANIIVNEIESECHTRTERNVAITAIEAVIASISKEYFEDSKSHD